MAAATLALRELTLGRWWPLGVISGFAWLCFSLWSVAPGAPDFCLSPSAARPAFLRAAAAMLSFDGGAQIARSWTLMIVAMMFPLLAPNLRHVVARTLSQRRFRAIGLFLATFVSTWLMAMVTIWSLLAMIQTSGVVSPQSLLSFVLAAGLVWHGSSTRRQLVNRSHVFPSLPAFGWRAEIGSMRFGARSAALCAGTCWASMAAPLGAASHHLPVMAAATAYVLVDRYSALSRPTTNWVMVLGGATVGIFLFYVG